MVRKTSLELILDFARAVIQDVLHHLDTHKFRGRVLFLSIGSCMIIWSLAFNADNIIKLVELFK